MHNNPLKPHSNPMRCILVSSSLLTDEETRAQRGQATCPRSISPSLKSRAHLHGVVCKGWASRARCRALSFSASGGSKPSILLASGLPGCLISTEAARLAVALKCESQIQVGKGKRWKLHSLLGA